jgi:hypothetical protein
LSSISIIMPVNCEFIYSKGTRDCKAFVKYLSSSCQVVEKLTIQFAKCFDKGISMLWFADTDTDAIL